MVLATDLAPPEPSAILPAWWNEPLRHHDEHARLRKSTARFKVIEAPRRSGKTMWAKREGVQSWTFAASETGLADWFGAAFAPTRDQAKAIYWEPFKAAIPTWLIAKNGIRESDLTIRHIYGPTLAVVGMDKPARAEGRPIDLALIDEFADMKPETWERHLRPALSTPGRLGRAWIYGVPRPSAQFQKLAEYAKSGIDPDWDYFWWSADGILDAAELEAAKRGMDELLYEQEYGGRRVPMSGRAYHAFSREGNVRESLPYDTNAPLILCLDFNIAPGSAVICQEGIDPKLGACTFVIGEIHIPRDSNTPLVCRRFIADWGHHKGPVHYYGDPTGGNRGTAKLSGSDWDLVHAELKTHFAGRLHDRVDRKRSPERSRVNALNTRLRNAAGEVHLLIWGARCAALIRDMENMLLKDGSDGALWKELDLSLGHWADGIGYYCEAKFPTTEHRFGIEPL